MRNNCTKTEYIILGILCLLSTIQCYKNNKNEIQHDYQGFVRISGGVYKIGSPKNEYGFNSKGNDEQIRNVKVNDFYIAQYEVTQKQYEEIMGKHSSSFSGDDYPVDNVTWYEAIDFCNRLSEREGLQLVYTIFKNTQDPDNYNIFDENRYLIEWNINANGYRLPTSSEWEIACRAGGRTAYNTGKTIKLDQANFGGSFSDNNTHIMPVGCFKPNSWGLYDMHGNVDEWCWDMLNNMGRVVRGGSWYDESYNLRSGRVAINTPTGKSIGFRLARNP